MPGTRLHHIAALLAGVALAATGCGDSDEQQAAQTTVCDARADIRTSVDGLQAMTPETFTAEGARSHLESIQSSLQTIRGAQDDLSDDRRTEVQEANQQFTAQIREIGATILRSTSAEQARLQARSAVADLGAAYRSTLATVDCS